jgi:hypothetical protein
VCPLGKFVQRGGEIAFTIPHDPDPVAAQRAGLVDQTIAREFAGTRFAGLLREADFAEVEDLPAQLESSLLASVNKAIGAGTDWADDGSYVNTDAQVTYQVYLVGNTRRTEIAGVPLRYYWSYARTGAAIIDEIQALSQSWAGRQALTDFARPNAEPTQYDIVALFQTAGVFKQMRRTNAASFDSFVRNACARQ